MIERWDLMAYIFPWAGWLVTVNPFANAIIYYIFLRRYRAKVRQLIFCWREPNPASQYGLLKVKQHPVKEEGDAKTLANV